MARFEVTELEGYFTPRKGYSKGPAGLSVHIVDVPWNRKLVFTARTENVSKRNVNHEQARAFLREQARERCAALNAAHDEAVAAADQKVAA